MGSQESDTTERLNWTELRKRGTSRVPLVVKKAACQCRRHKRRAFDPWVRKIPWRRALTTYSSILAWRIQWTEKPGWLQSIVWQRVGHDWRLSMQHARKRVKMVNINHCFNQLEQMEGIQLIAAKMFLRVF